MHLQSTVIHEKGERVKAFVKLECIIMAFTKLWVHWEVSWNVWKLMRTWHGEVVRGRHLKKCEKNCGVKNELVIAQITNY